MSVKTQDANISRSFAVSAVIDVGSIDLLEVASSVVDIGALGFIAVTEVGSNIRLVGTVTRNGGATINRVADFGGTDITI